MPDLYLDLVNSGFTRQIARRLGLPQPAVLRRTDPGHIDQPLAVGPVVVIGDGSDADSLSAALLEWDLDVRRGVSPGTKIGAIMLVLTDLTDPIQAGTRVLATGGLLRDLLPSGRVISVARAARPDDAATSAVRAGVGGLMRSLAKELRGGATGNGVELSDQVPVDAPSSIGTLRFLLSARSAFVDGQLLRVDAGGAAPAQWRTPLTDRVAVVTGAARGIGAEISRVLTRDGAQVVGVDLPAAGEALAKVMNQVKGTALQLDITAADAGDRIIDLVRSRYHRLDLVVHNAGILRDKLLANMSPERWESVVTVNIDAQLRMTEALLAAQGLAPDGLRLVSLASTSGIAGNRGQTNYGFTKAAVIGATTSWAEQLKDSGGTANAVAPGFIETDMTARIPTLTRQVARRLNSLQQGGQAVDVAEAVAFLASPQAGGINGQVLRVCGQNLVGR
ncbi:MAG: 3-oxoacyl-ACP reductase [Beutenbergiaceae bacterium]